MISDRSPPDISWSHYCSNVDDIHASKHSSQQRWREHRSSDGTHDLSCRRYRAYVTISFSHKYLRAYSAENGVVDVLIRGRVLRRLRIAIAATASSPLAVRLCTGLLRY